MHKYCVEVMLHGYKSGPKIAFEAVNDSEACNQGWKLAKAQFGCIAYSVSHRVGRHKVYVSL